MNKLLASIEAIILALKKKETPVWLKLSVIATAIYIVMPIDLIPDIPFIGYLDDLTLLSIMVGILNKGIPDDIMEKAREEVTRRRQNQAQNTNQNQDHENVIDYDEVIKNKNKRQ